MRPIYEKLLAGAVVGGVAILFLLNGLGGTAHAGKVDSWPPSSKPDRGDWTHHAQVDVAMGGRFGIEPRGYVSVNVRTKDGVEVLDDGTGIRYGRYEPDITWETFDTISVVVREKEKRESDEGQQVLRRAYRWSETRQEFLPVGEWDAGGR